MKVKFFMPLLFFVGSSMFFSQAKKVGINTNSPRQTLDVNGTLRVQQLGSAKKGSGVLGWNQNTKELVEMDLLSDSVFQRRTILVPVKVKDVEVENPQDRSHKIVAYTSLKVEDYSLGIDSRKFSVVLLSSKLVYDEKKNPTKKGKPVSFLKTVNVAGSGAVNGSGFDNSWENKITNVQVVQNSGGYKMVANNGFRALKYLLPKSTLVPLLYEIPRQSLVVKTIKGKSTWCFTGEYLYSSPSDVEAVDFMWQLELFVVNNKWIRSIHEATVKSDAAGVLTRENGEYPIVK